jgi:hypothetical protein
MDSININSFLYFGYFLDFTNTNYSFDFSMIDKKRYLNAMEEELIDIGTQKFLKSINNCFVRNNTNIVVPISGGLDSRAILAGLLEFTSASNIKTYTFGTPYTLDYEIGNKIAKEFGTDHMSISFKDYIFSMDELIKTSNRIHNQTVLFHNPPIGILDKYYSNHSIWSGFAGDLLAGSHYNPKVFFSIIEEKNRFIEENRFVKSIELKRIDHTQFYKMINVTKYSSNNLTIKEQIDFENRQLKYIAPHVLIKGFQYQLPFLDKSWVNFILSVDNNYRKNQYLYKKILLNAFPKAFECDSKSNYGFPISKKLSKLRKNIIRIHNKMRRVINQRWNIFVDPYINYMDYNNGIRERKDLYKIVYENINDLKKRDLLPWLDIDKIWSDHISCKKNYADALLVIASLEIHLKAIEEKELK